MPIAILAACAGLPARPLPPKVDIESLRVVVTPAGDARFRVLLDVTNPNPYDVAVRTVEATIRLEDERVATASLPEPVILSAAGHSHVAIEGRPDFGALQKVFGPLLRNLAGRYEISGFAVVQDGRRLDFHKRGDLPLGELLGKLR